MSALLALGLALSAGVAGVVVWGRAQPVRYKHVANWDETPRVWAPPEADREMLEIAAELWEQGGYQVEFVDDWRKATVTIDIDPNLDRRGNTHLWLSPSGDEIKSATITVRRNDSLVYAHEFGHMFGIKHKLGPADIVMNPINPGWDTRGIKKGEINSRGRDP